MKSLLFIIPAIFIFCTGSVSFAQQSHNGVLKLGGFRCFDLKRFRNDDTFDLFEFGPFTASSFRMEVFKRNGVPFWYPRDAGDIHIAGAEWRPVVSNNVSSSAIGGVAHAESQEPGNGAVNRANDGDPTSYWYAGSNHPTGRLWIDFADAARISAIHILAWASPRHAPADYSVGVILPSGEWKEVAKVDRDVRDETNGTIAVANGGWVSFPVDNVVAKGIYIDVRSTGQNEHGPVVYELQAQGEFLTPRETKRPDLPSEVAIPLHGLTAEELFCLGHVGDGFDALPDVKTPVGEYVLNYANGQKDTIELMAGENVASIRYGHFVPEATFAFGFTDKDAQNVDPPGTLYYHLGEMLPVPPKKQLMMFGHSMAHPDWPIESLTFRCTNPKASLILAGLTFRQSGPRLNALVYNGKQVKVYPDKTLKAAPSPIDVLIDRSRILSLDGEWLFATDPANEGMRRGYYSMNYDTSGWQKMPVPSQWYVQGIDYHGAAWYRREFDVPTAFPGSVIELDFGGVDYDARVWVNGDYVGRHVGAFSWFKLDATRAIKKGVKNTIVVRVESPIDPGYFQVKTLIKGNSMYDIAMPYNEEGCMGGIVRPVALRGRGDVGIENVNTISTVSKDLKRAAVSIRFDLQPVQQSGDGMTVKCRMIEPTAGKSKPRVFSVEKTFPIAGTTPPNPSWTR